MINCFSPQWFKKYQKAILFYANTVGRDRLQIETNQKITSIEPHSVTWLEDKHGLKSTTFYPGNVFSWGLQKDLLPFWKILHAFDIAPLPRRLGINFGFDSLTVYPDPHPETNTVDGLVTRVVAAGAAFATIRSGVGTAFNDSATAHNLRLVAHASTADTYAELGRFAALFNTASLTSGANISAATYSVYCNAAGATQLGDCNFCLVTSDPALATVALAAADYQRTWGTTDLYETPFAISTIGTGRTTKNISAAGLALISKTGITKFGNLIGWDLTGDTTALVWGASLYTRVALVSTDYSTPATYSPQLIVTYTTANVYKILVSGAWKTISSTKVLTGGAWKDATAAKQLVNGAWKTLF